MTSMRGEPFTDRDKAMLASHGLTLADATAALLGRVSDEEGAEIVGQRRTAHRDFSGIVFSYLRDGRVVSYRLRRAHPDLEQQSDGAEPKERNKYLSAPGERGHLYIPPTAKAEWFTDTGIDVAMTEGEWKVLSLHRLSFEDNSTEQPRWLAVGLAGVWNFRGVVGKATNADGRRVDVRGPIPDLDLIRWEGRRVKIVFDSDVQTNSAVRQAPRELAVVLVRRGAIVEFVDVPDAPDGAKWGVDDWYGAAGAQPVLDALAHGKLFDFSVSNVLAIVEELPETPTIPEIAEAMTNTAGMLTGANKLTVALVREGCCRALKERGVSSPPKIVDVLVGADSDSATQPSGLSFVDPEPWDVAVSGSDLLDEMVATQRRFVSAEPALYHTVALWALFTHAFESFYCLPILLITAATKRAGKSTLLTVLSALVRRPVSASNLTEAVLYRVIEAYKPTLLLDECDTFLRDNEALRGVINSGHTQANAMVMRCVGESHEVELFSTFAPKALAGIGRQADTITDRSIVARLKRATAAQRREHLRLDRLSTLEPLRAKAARWVLDNADALAQADPIIPDEMTNDRARDNWRTLFAVADLAGGEWPRRARAAALTLTESDDDTRSVGELLISDLRTLFCDLELGDGERIESAKIAEHLHGPETRPWSEWGRQKKPITPVGIAKLLKDHDVKPDHWREGDRTARGYWVAAFRDVFTRYCGDDSLPVGIPVGTPGTRPTFNSLQESDSAQNVNSVPSRIDGNSLTAKDRADRAESDAPNTAPGSVGLFEQLDIGGEQRPRGSVLSINTIESLIRDLSGRGVIFEPIGDRLRIDPVENLQPGELERVREHKREILNLFRSGRVYSTKCEGDGDCDETLFVIDGVAYCTNHKMVVRFVQGKQ